MMASRFSTRLGRMTNTTRRSNSAVVSAHGEPFGDLSSRFGGSSCQPAKRTIDLLSEAGLPPRPGAVVRRPLEHGAYPGQDLANVKRFGDVVIGS